MVMGEEELIGQLKKMGIRVTPQRQEIIMLLLKRAEAGGPPLSADEIMQHIRKRYPSISLDTVYRSLATFTKAGLIRELQFKEHSRRFELIYEDDHHHHFVCLGPVYLEKPNRVQVLGYVFILVLLIFSYLEYRVRKSLKENNEYVLLPGKKKTDCPTTKTIMEYFSSVCRSVRVMLALRTCLGFNILIYQCH